MSYSRLKRNLLMDTRANSHYRSYGIQTGNVSSAAFSSQVNLVTIKPVSNGSAAFWTTSGGAQELDSGITVPSFSGDIILRGGKWTFNFTNTSNKTMKLYVYYVFTISRPDFTVIPATPFATWDPTLIPEFRDKVGKVQKSEVVILKNGEGVAWERRIPTMKVDQFTWDSDGNIPILILGVQNLEENTIIAGSAITGFNMSFAGDSV